MLKPTNRLRWLKHNSDPTNIGFTSGGQMVYAEKVLQQLWVEPDPYDMGMPDLTREWRDIPIETE